MTPDHKPTIEARIAAYEARAEALRYGLDDIKPISRTIVMADAMAAFEAAEMLRGVLVDDRVVKP
jgi:hypothetical protein